MWECGVCSLWKGAQIISGVSVPLGLWKPSLATINRSAGHKLTLAGGRPLAATVERQDKSRACLLCPQHVCKQRTRGSVAAISLKPSV